jgi:hypothetical protein
MGELAADALAVMGPSGLDVLVEISAGDGPPAALAARVLGSMVALQKSA